jgi:hypothetical protein
MVKIDTAAVAFNSAGIAAAYTSLCYESNSDDDRFVALSDESEGWLGVIGQITDAGEIMERFRVLHGTSSTWGGDLPYLYDVWDSIAEALLANLGNLPFNELVESAIERVVQIEPD